MPNKPGPSALKAALNGERLSDRQTKSALSTAIGRITELSKTASHSKESMLATGAQVMFTAETQGALFLSSMAEGYLGPQRLEVGGVDVRAPIGLVATGYGLYETMYGRNDGAHALAIGNGVLGSWLASVAMSAGNTLAQRRGRPQVIDAPPPVQLTPSSLQGLMPAPAYPVDPATGLREILLTPEPDDGFEGPGRGRGGGRRGGGRGRARGQGGRGRGRGGQGRGRRQRRRGRAPQRSPAPLHARSTPGARGRTCPRTA